MNKIYLGNKSLAVFLGYFIFTLSLICPFLKAEAVSLSPVRFEIKGNPGETLVQDLIISNETKTTETYYSSFANFEAQGETGNPAFVEPKDDLGVWMNIKESIVLTPGASEVVPLTIRIPKDAEPGGHFAVVFFGNSPKGKGGQVSVGANTGVLVLLSVNGDVKEGGGVNKFNLKDDKFIYNSLPVSFEYKFKNEGNDRIKPVGFLKIRNILFLPVKNLNGNIVDGNILPKSVRKFDVIWVNDPRKQDYLEPVSPILNFLDHVKYQWRNFAFGLYSANLELSFNNLNFSGGKRLYFFVFPWQLILVLIVLVSIVFFGGSKLLSRYNQYIIKKAQVGNNLPS